MAVLIGGSRVKVSNIIGGSVAAGFYTDASDPTSVPTGAPVGAPFLNTTSGDVFQLGSNMQWTKVGNVRGPSGTGGLTADEIQALITDALSGFEPPASGGAGSVALDDEGFYYLNLTGSTPGVGTIALDDDGYPYIQNG